MGEFNAAIPCLERKDQTLSEICLVGECLDGKYQENRSTGAPRHQCTQYANNQIVAQISQDLPVGKKDQGNRGVVLRWRLRGSSP